MPVLSARRGTDMPGSVAQLDVGRGVVQHMVGCDSIAVDDGDAHEEVEIDPSSSLIVLSHEGHAIGTFLRAVSGDL